MSQNEGILTETERDLLIAFHDQRGDWHKQRAQWLRQGQAAAETQAEEETPDTPKAITKAPAAAAEKPKAREFLPQVKPERKAKTAAKTETRSTELRTPAGAPISRIRAVQLIIAKDHADGGMGLTNAEVRAILARDFNDGACTSETVGAALSTLGAKAMIEKAGRAEGTNGSRWVPNQSARKAVKEGA